MPFPVRILIGEREAVGAVAKVVGQTIDEAPYFAETFAAPLMAKRGSV